MLMSLLYNKEKLIELENTPVSENCSAVILKKLPEKLGDPVKFLILCGFSKLKCKALADLGASINLIPLSVWKKLGLPELISTQMTLELVNRDICTPKGIARDVFVMVGKFTFPADFVIVDYESVPRVPLILGRPFLWIARALIDVHGEEMIIHDGDERLTLNIRNDTSSYSNQPHKESINMIDINQEYLENLFSTSHPSGNPTLTSEISDYSLEEFADELALIESFPPGNDDMTPKDVISEIEYLLSRDPLAEYSPNNDLIDTIFEEFVDEPALDYSSPPRYDDVNDDQVDLLLEEFADELALIDLFHRENDDMTPEDVIKEKECLLNQSPLANYSHSNDLVDTVPEMFTDEHALDYSSPPLWDDYDDNLFDHETVNDDTYDDPFDFKEEKIKDSKILIDELDPPRSSDFLPFPECDTVFYEDFFEVDTLPSTNNEDKDFNPPPLYELPCHKEVPGLGILLSFSSKNEEKVFNPGILTSTRVHTSYLPGLSYQDSKAFKVINIFESPMEIFPCSYQEDIRVL
ncbi:reverse transcriptase domain-containing protein, partial [Tanacetum coccineum]